MPTQEEQDKAAAKQVLKSWCDLQRQKYGPDWAAILAKEMAEKNTPIICALLGVKQ